MSIYVAALLVSGIAIAGLFALFALGIHGYHLSKTNRYHASRRLADAPRTRAEAITRRVLGLTTQNGNADLEEQEGKHINE